MLPTINFKLNIINPEINTKKSYKKVYNQYKRNKPYRDVKDTKGRYQRMYDNCKR